MTATPRPPYLHDLVTCLAAPWVALGGSDADLSGAGAQGVFARDRRVLSRLEVRVDGHRPEPVSAASAGAPVAEFVAVLGGYGESGHDPTVTLRRRRRVDGGGLVEEIVLDNRSAATVRCELSVGLGCDLAGTDAVRSGAAAGLPDLTPARVEGGLRWTDAGGAEVTALLDPAPDSVGDDGTVRWACAPAAGTTTTVTVRVTARIPAAGGFGIEPPARRVDRSDEVEVDCDDSRVAAWLCRSLSDVAGLTLADPEDAGDRYLGAGPPWYLTLFGRDSLISAGMLLAVDPGLAAGTLRALARRQGTRTDVDAAEQPGKIAHELRMTTGEHGGGLVLPPAYYGSVDSTLLWLTTLHRAWRWGMPAAEVAALIPAVEGALGWLRDHADPDGDGFCEYVDDSGHGLANQGWKDSADAVQWPDGTLAAAPIALCEVQGYAYAAALAGADLLDAFGGADTTCPESRAPRSAGEWRAWAADLRGRFRAAFWVDDAAGGYPAIALDAAKAPVTGPASNMGHLLGTGILDPADAAAVAARLAGPELDSGFGLRTLATTARRFNPLGYHTGSVWPHDTAMAVEGLAATGHAGVAAGYVDGLLRAAEAFGYRLPELYGGAGRAAEVVPTPYPLSCRPQAWAAASPVAVLTALLGLAPDVPNGRLRVAPVRPFPWRRLEVRGLRLAGGRLSLRVVDGEVTVLESPLQPVTTETPATPASPR